MACLTSLQCPRWHALILMTHIDQHDTFTYSWHTNIHTKYSYTQDTFAPTRPTSTIIIITIFTADAIEHLSFTMTVLTEDAAEFAEQDAKNAAEKVQRTPQTPHGCRRERISQGRMHCIVRKAVGQGCHRLLIHSHRHLLLNMVMKWIMATMMALIIWVRMWAPCSSILRPKHFQWQWRLRCVVWCTRWPRLWSLACSLWKWWGRVRPPTHRDRSRGE